MDSGILDFISEAKESLSSIEVLVVKLESSPEDDELINAIFRPFHSLKGSAGFFGFHNVRQVAHKAESLLSAIRKKQIVVGGRVTDSLLQGGDLLNQALERILEGDESYELRPEEEDYLRSLDALLAAKPAIDLELFDRLRDLLRRESAKREELAQSETVLDLLDHLERVYVLVAQQAEGTGEADEAPEKTTFYYQDRELTEEIFTLRTTIVELRAGPLSDESALAFQETFSQLGDILHALPEVGEAITGIKPYLPFLDDELLTSDEGVQKAVSDAVRTIIDAVEENARVQKMGEILVQDGIVSEEEVSEATARQKKLGEILVAGGKATDQQVTRSLEKQRGQILAREKKDRDQEKYIRVSQDKIDSFIQEVADGVVFAESFHYLYSRLESTVQDQALLDQMNESIQGLEELIKNLQDKVLSIRQAPLKQLFQKLPRMVRELSRNLGLEVNLEVFGEEIAVDKNIIEHLEDPLVHMVRNALDHGIEKDAEQRRKLGKPAVGALRVGAKTTEEHLLVTIEDDGAGLVREVIEAKAIERELISESQAGGMSDSEIFNCIFAPGFSTAETVTDVSGRGVGMDVVRSNIEELKGRVLIESQVGRGTRFTLRIPLSQVLISRDAIFFGSGGEKYSIPFDEVEKSLETPVASLTSFTQRSLFLNYNGSVMEVVPFSCLVTGTMRAEEICKKYAEDQSGRVIVIVLEERGQYYGLLVEELLAPHKVVINPLDDTGIPPAGRDIFAGTSILGSGEVVLVLSAKAVTKKIRQTGGDDGPAGEAKEEEERE